MFFVYTDRRILIKDEYENQKESIGRLLRNPIDCVCFCRCNVRYYVIMELGYSKDNRLERNPQNSLNQRVFLQPFLFLHPIFLKST